MNKIIRNSIISLIGGVLLFGGTLYVQAANQADVSHPIINCKVHGFIQFVEGPLIISDKIWYSGTLSGSDRYLIVPATTAKDAIAYITPGTDKKTLSSIRLWYGREIITNYEVPCGYGGTKGKLKIYCGGNSRTIYSY